MECSETLAMTGAEALACSVALARFQSDEKGADLVNYRVLIRENSDHFDVAFVPNQGPEYPHRIELGGGTVFGREVHYLVDKINYQITKVHFAR